MIRSNLRKLGFTAGVVAVVLLMAGCAKTNNLEKSVKKVAGAKSITGKLGSFSDTGL